MLLKLFKKRILKEIENLLGYCTCWDDGGIITYEDKDGRGTSMSIKTFKENLFR